MITPSLLYSCVTVVLGVTVSRRTGLLALDLECVFVAIGILFQIFGKTQFELPESVTRLEAKKIPPKLNVVIPETVEITPVLENRSSPMFTSYGAL